MASQRDVKNKIASVKNIQKITRAMEMVAAARLRRAEQRIAGGEAARVPLLREHDSETNVGLLLVTGDRGLAGGFNSQIIRAGTRLSAEISEQGLHSTWYATGRRGVSSLNFRGHELSGSYTGFADRPAYADARTIADDVIQAYVDGQIDRVEMIYNSYVSPLTQHVTRQTLLPLTHQEIAGEGEDSDGQERRPTSVDYEPDPEKILRRLVPDYIEVSIYRALVESSPRTASFPCTTTRCR